MTSSSARCTPAAVFLDDRCGCRRVELSACNCFGFGGVEVLVTAVAAAGGCAITVFSVRVRLIGLTSVVTFVVSVACSSLNKVVATSGSASSIASSCFHDDGQAPLVHTDAHLSNIVEYTQLLRDQPFQIAPLSASFCDDTFSLQQWQLQRMRDVLKDLIHPSERDLLTVHRFHHHLLFEKRLPSLTEMLAFVCLAAPLLPLVEGCQGV